jgi:hypothetical protein
MKPNRAKPGTFKLRRIKLGVLLTLVMGWASLVHAMEQSGTIANYIYVETVVR